MSLVCSVLLVDCCLLFGVCCLLCVDRCLLFVVCWLLVVCVCHWLLNVRRQLLRGSCKLLDLSSQLSVVI